MTKLDHVPLFKYTDFSEWRDLYHLGGRFFCSVATAALINVYDLTRHQPYCRGVWIYVFEEVELPASKSTHFRTIASLSYRIRTPFENTGYFIRCCAFGSVPDSWVKKPVKIKKVAQERKTFKDQQIQHSRGCGSKGQEALAVAARDQNHLLVAARDEIMRLKAELAEKDALLETLLAANLNLSDCIGDDGAEKTPKTGILDKIAG